MDVAKWVELIAEFFAGLAVLIPLVISLYKAIKVAAQEKNWNKIAEIVINLMVEAEKQFSEGIAKKAWVMGEVRKAAELIDYTYDNVAENKVSEMIDSICDASRILNNKVGD